MKKLSPKDKAKELYNKFSVMWHEKTDDVIASCHIVVDEVLYHLLNPFIPSSSALHPSDDEDVCYWVAVKNEIDNLKIKY